MDNRLQDKNHSNERSQDESKTEETDLSSASGSNSYYGSTSLQDGSVPGFYVPWCGVVFYVMAFFGFISSLLVRVGLSVAIVAMVNQTAVTDEDVVMSNVTEAQCPRDPELQYEDGEFIWDRNQQGIVLAAFYYGYGFTQVYYTPGYLRVRGPHIQPQVSWTFKIFVPLTYKVVKLLHFSNML